MSLPLHPVMVHLPLALALLMPIFAAVAAWALWTGRIGRRAWLGIAALQLLLVSTAIVAVKTGEGEEDRVEAVVPESAMHQHEEYAEQFTWGAVVVLGFTLIALVPAAGRSFALVTLLGTMAVAGLAIRVGHAGGQLVYVHNAGAAYRSGVTDRAAAAAGPDERTAAAASDQEDEENPGGAKARRRARN